MKKTKVSQKSQMTKMRMGYGLRKILQLIPSNLMQIIAVLLRMSLKSTTFSGGAQRNMMVFKT